MLGLRGRSHRDGGRNGAGAHAEKRTDDRAAPRGNSGTRELAGGGTMADRALASTPEWWSAGISRCGGGALCRRALPPNGRVSLRPHSPGACGARCSIAPWFGLVESRGLSLVAQRCLSSIGRQIRFVGAHGGLNKVESGRAATECAAEFFGIPKKAPLRASIRRRSAATRRSRAARRRTRSDPECLRPVRRPASGSERRTRASGPQPG